MTINVTHTDAAFDVDINYDDLASDLVPHFIDYIDDAILTAVDDSLVDAIDRYIQSGLAADIDIEEKIGDLLDGVGTGDLCYLGEKFRSAIEVILEQHLDLGAIFGRNLAYAGKRLAINVEVVDIEQPTMVDPTPDVDLTTATVVSTTPSATADVSASII